MFGWTKMLCKWMYMYADICVKFRTDKTQPIVIESRALVTIGSSMIQKGFEEIFWIDENENGRNPSYIEIRKSGF